MQSNDYHLRVEVSRIEGGLEAVAILCQKGEDQVIGQCAVQDATGAHVVGEAELILQVEGLSASLTFAYDQTDGAAGKTVRGSSLLCSDIDIRKLSTEVAGGFVGCTVGMYAVADEDCREQAACFRRLSYQA